MPQIQQRARRQNRPARRAGLVAAASLLATLAMPPAASGTPVLAAPVPVVATDPAPELVSAAPEVRVEVTSPVASVVAPVAAPTGDRWEVVGAAASARLLAAGIDPADVGYTVDYLPGRGGYRGLTIPSQRRIEMYVRADHDVDDVLRVLVHELGHAVSETCMDATDRATYDAVRGLRVGWYPSAHGLASGTEDHAEVFAWSVLGGLRDMKATGGGTPGSGELASLRAAGLLSTC
jgi:hypothetical protein